MYKGNNTIDNLSNALEYLNLSNNILTGCVNMQQYARQFARLNVLDLHSNRLIEGIIFDDFESDFPLPNLTYVDLSGNWLHGNFTLRQIPPRLEYLDISINRFTQLHILDNDNSVFSLTSPFSSFFLQQLEHFPLLEVVTFDRSHVRENASTVILPPKLQILSGSDNALCGRLNLSILPSTLEYLDLSGNELTELILEEFNICINEHKTSFLTVIFLKSKIIICLQYNNTIILIYGILCD
ncbi:lrr receptor protein kinase [Reticulomyxa filosa]|uniref:Lrr receptor protein kinase n=1 Tax=Reticulomyxa filosa TaxID=46433 RepID=X6L9I4_RETFI|nr:lrr receptor protein kinase [Reticulomyxa filosa]|eukprot:ETN98198.1 lrr receptor protein kinase [Reticulomyxa filosa]